MDIPQFLSCLLATVVAQQSRYSRHAAEKTERLLVIGYQQQKSRKHFVLCGNKALDLPYSFCQSHIYASKDFLPQYHTRAFKINQCTIGGTLCTLSIMFPFLSIVGIIRNKPCRVFRETLVFCLDMKAELTALQTLPKVYNL